MAVLLYFVFVALAFIAWKLKRLIFIKKNPFLEDSRIPLKEQVIDQKARDKVLKNSFKLEKVPKDLDAIIIGSGIGGLSTASILAKAGKRVLVLEQHDQAGGCCHTFIEKGYEFDVGIHYVGEMHDKSISKTYLDQISDGQIQWELMNNEFDCVVIKDKNANQYNYYPILLNVEKQKANLKKLFPDEKEAIDKFYQMVSDAYSGYRATMALKFIPLFIVNIITRTGLIHKITNFFRYNERSLKSVVDELTPNQTLRDVFSYCFGDYGVVPSKVGFPLQALLMQHYSEGAYYPVGGASEIAHSIIPVIERGGGKVLVRAEVTNILLDSDEKTKGVKVKHGKQEFDIFAPMVISDAGIKNTFKRLLPPEVATKSRLFKFCNNYSELSALSVFVGLNASASELGIEEKKNFWIFSENNIDKACVDYLSLSKEETEERDSPLIFLSFPSTKDPSWNERYPGKTTMAVITFSNYKWFKEWEKEPCQRRGDEYEGYKKTLGWKLIEQISSIYPKINDHIDFISFSSPLSNNFYLGSIGGEIYGMNHNISRFSPMNMALLRPTTDVKGLFLTGQDISSCGFVGALWGGMICAQQILGRNVVNDLTKLHKRIQKKNRIKSE